MFTNRRACPGASVVVSPLTWTNNSDLDAGEKFTGMLSGPNFDLLEICDNKIEQPYRHFKSF